MIVDNMSCSESSYSLILFCTNEERALQRQQVLSSRIYSIGYDPKTHNLEIEFHNKDIYQYVGVPESIYKKFISDAVVSKGRFFDGVIKDKFLCRKIR